jgi:hypothetical protein
MVKAQSGEQAAKFARLRASLPVLPLIERVNSRPIAGERHRKSLMR